jgi:hypothetical protein
MISDIIATSNLSEGCGRRLWPLSRARCPKQLLRLEGDQTIMQMAAPAVRNRMLAKARQRGRHLPKLLRLAPVAFMTAAPEEYNG